MGGNSGEQNMTVDNPIPPIVSKNLLEILISITSYPIDNLLVK